MWHTQDAQAERLDLGLPRQVVLPVRQVGVAEHRRDGRERLEAREDVERADIAGVDDALRAGEQLVQLRVVVAVGVADDTDEGRTVLGHADRIQAVADGWDGRRGERR